MKRLFRNGLIALLCAVLTALAFSGLLLLCHHCEGEGCPVCLAVGEALRITAAAEAALFACGLFTALSRARRMAERRAALCLPFSLVRMKTELLS